MALIITKTIENCKRCRHIGHSGNFTPGGAKPICDHPNVSKCIKKVKGLRDDSANDLPDSKLGKQCWYWKNRVIPYKVVEDEYVGRRKEPKGTIPKWCPLMNGKKY